MHITLKNTHSILKRKSLNIICQKRQIFQCKKVRTDIKLRDIEELRITSCHMSLKNKIELFYANGVDYEKVFKYYHYVKKLNDIYYQPIEKSKEKYNILNQFCKFWKVLQVFISIII